jgi:hypothetical protein
VFFEALTLRMNDPDFSGGFPFHDDHLDGKDGKSGILKCQCQSVYLEVDEDFEID